MPWPGNGSLVRLSSVPLEKPTVAVEVSEMRTPSPPTSWISLLMMRAVLLCVISMPALLRLWMQTPVRPADHAIAHRA